MASNDPHVLFWAMSLEEHVQEYAGSALALIEIAREAQAERTQDRCTGHIPQLNLSRLSEHNSC